MKWGSPLYWQSNGRTPPKCTPPTYWNSDDTKTAQISPAAAFPMSNESSVEADLPGGTKIRAIGSDVLVGACLLVSVVAAYALWEHKMDAKADSISLVSSIRELAAAQRETTKELIVAQRETTIAQRELNCLISFRQELREREFSSDNGLCKRLARER